jgi:serine/threonine protein kinase
MKAIPDTHPSAETLRAFGLGMLDGAAAKDVMSHLEGCAECQKNGAALSGDSFVNRLRAAQGRAPTVPMPIPGVPPELAASRQYQVIRELGRGGMGVVYLAKNLRMDRMEVLKVVSKELLDKPGAADRFLREIRSAAKLSHDNVVKAYSSPELGDLLVFAMEYVEGEDLAKVVKAHGPLPVANACFYAQQAAHGLQHAFEKGMVHRDIKPQNLILARESRKHIVKVLDFGLAKATREKGTEHELTGAGKMLGTPDYIAPEQTLDAASADIRADIYSLGCTLYYLLAATPPFKGKSLFEILQAHHSVQAKPLNQVRPEVPADLAAVVAKMMAKAPEERFQKPIDVAQVLLPFVMPTNKATANGPSSSPAAENDAKPVGAAVMRPETVLEGRPTMGEARNPATPAVLPSPSKSVAKRMLLSICGAVAAVLVLALLGMWASGVLKVKTKDGTIVLENLPPDADVLVDGDKVTVTWGDGGKNAQITVKPGTHKVVATKDGVKVIGEEVEITDGGRKVITARVEQPAKSDLPGFVPLFDGKDLTGWYVESGDARQWAVEGEAIVARSADWKTSNYLLSKKEYADFTLRLEFMIDPGGNSAIAIRAIQGEKLPNNWSKGNGAMIPAHPQFKLTYSAEWRIGTPMWLMDDRMEGKPSAKLEVKTGVWQPLEVTVRGDTCRATVGGKTVMDVKLNPDAKANGSIVPGLKRAKGKIGFHAHSGTVRFRRVQIKELSKPQAEEKGFVPLFNGKDLTGWKTTPEWGDLSTVENGNLIWRRWNYLWTERNDYRNFHLRAEVRIGDRIYSQLIVRFTFNQLGRKHLGYAIVLNSTNENSCKTGSLIDVGKGPVVTVSKSPVPPDKWFTVEVIADGNRIRVLVNGQTTADYPDPNRHLSRGHISILGVGGKREGNPNLAFRKIEIKELPVAKPEPDAFTRGSIWKGELTRRASDAPGREQKHAVVFTVTERDGTTFKARMEILGAGPYNQVREVRGTIENGKIKWSAQDVKVLKGHAGHDHIGEVTGKHIELRYKGPAALSPDVHVEGEVTLSREE